MRRKRLHDIAIAASRTRQVAGRHGAKIEVPLAFDPPHVGERQMPFDLHAIAAPHHAVAALHIIELSLVEPARATAGSQDAQARALTLSP